MKVRLNKRTIDDAVYEGPGGCYLWDTEMAVIFPPGIGPLRMRVFKPN